MDVIAIEPAGPVSGGGSLAGVQTGVLRLQVAGTQSGSPSATQCAAVSTTERVIRDPPQNCRSWASKPGKSSSVTTIAACHGYCSIVAVWPPITRGSTRLSIRGWHDRQQNERETGQEGNSDPPHYRY